MSQKKELYRSIAEQKLKSFSIGNMGKRGISKKEQEELKKKQDEEEVKNVYQEFVSTFEDAPSSKVNKTWIKAGTFNAGNRKEDFSDKGKLYKPQAKLDYNVLKRESKMASSSSSHSDAKRPEKPGKKKEKEKKKSNLEIFKEELKAMQEEREERHRIKGMLKSSLPTASAASIASKESSYLGDIGDKIGSHDTGDPNTTNLYLGNLSPRLTEQQLLELFGKYGPLASIKIMWPRTEDEKARGRNCGFVAYMSRRDGERALSHLLGKDIDGFEMKMGWGKPVPIPLQPIYIPPALLRLTMPPERTGLPFNCQPDKENEENFDKMLYNAKVKVVIPGDRTQLCLINRMVEFVIREGPMFEAMIMNREMNNRNFQFLFENKSPEHIYYRWRLYSMLQGDNKDDWNTEPFRMFKGGSLWIPPTKNIYTAGMPEHVFEASLNEDTSAETLGKKPKSDKPKKVSEEPKKKNNGLSDSQRDRFEDMLRNLLPDRNPVAETMVWCIEHAEAGEEIVDCIAESLSILQTPLTKKIARLYLISDILHNCSVKGVPNVSFYRQGFQSKLPEIFTDLNQCYQSIESRIRAEAFKQRVINCFRAWEDWALYPQDFLIKLQNIFMGFVGKIEEKVESEEEDDDVDGVPLDGAALLKTAAQKASGTPQRNIGTPVSRLSRREDSDDSDVDGVPLEPKKPIAKAPAGFVPSKWETVDPDEVQAQAVTSKWDIFDQDEDGKNDEDDIDGVPMQDDKDDELLRQRLREVEVKVMVYQDDLECGKESLRPGWTLSDQVRFGVANLIAN